MPGYVQMTVIAGDTMEVFKHFDTRKGIPEKVRAARELPTPEEVKRINERNAERKLRWKINTNFGAGDFSLNFTYRKHLRPADRAEAEKDARLLMRRLRDLYARHGKELKDIRVGPAIGEQGAVHLHLICNGDVPEKEIKACWKKGFSYCTTMDDSNHAALAHYLIKQSREWDSGDITFKRWSCSRNLKEPTIIRKFIKAASWRKDITPPKGWLLEKTLTALRVDIMGHPSIEFHLRRAAPTRTPQQERKMRRRE